MELEEIRKKVEQNEYEISFHAEKERYAEDIAISDLENVIYNGEILEDYHDDPRGPSCLILGYSQNRPVHIVCGYTPIKWIRIITVYIPKRPKWINERRRSKSRSRGDEMR
ncbi:MAG: DUF4258 domain-containing protein [archaeon]|nr:DUF4258 domain-containing protein [archaeon]